ncbi:primosomal protein N' [Bifidobacterium xylocopae]|uniref:Primosome assembly protein PriA n=1 Tax=Bifidobacterium xylocopae TaxID=2493119 RepID=A0A366KEC6_9BIFI|nr:primosomal protein N' [Bifidobacterium xylocopae]RBP99929.1 primosome assembly protein PriA [Bifidobacterium xylocopae]
MSQVAEQPALDGLDRPRRKPSRKRVRQQAGHLPIAQVVLDVQAAHLGRTFDYLVDERDDQAAQPGVLVRVRFGGQRLNGIIWGRTESSEAPKQSLRYLERVVVKHPLVSASMRDDLTAIAKAFGGTRANILRLALPPRVARIEREQAFADTRSGTHPGEDSDGGTGCASTGARERLTVRLGTAYPEADELKQALVKGGFAAFVVDALPGPEEREHLMVWAILTALASGRQALAVLPDARHMESLSVALRMSGLRPFAPDPAGQGGWSGDYVLLGSTMAPADRYRAYLAVATGQVSCVIGLRAAMYAPVEGPALFMILDDGAYQNADGMTPYANARGVLRLRARSHEGVFLSLGHARSALSQWECSPEAVQASSGVTGPARPLEPDRSAVSARLPWVRWLNREELTRLADPTIGARVPHTAVAVLNKALERGPVLLSIPQDGVTQALSCAACHRQARCPRCAGPLHAAGVGHAPRCSWCGQAAVDWSCGACGCERMRLVRVGAAGTAEELRLLFRGQPIVISTPYQPRGIVETIDDRPRLVIATPGAEPRIVPRSPEGSQAYAGAAILDAWTSLYALGIDARIDTLTAWMRVAALCAPRADGGQVLVLGESDSALVQALITWRPAVLAAAELADRAEAGLPPTQAAAVVWGGRDPVMGALESVGALPGGDLGTVEVDGQELPALMGPVPIAPESKLKTGVLEGVGDRVRALVRVPVNRRDELAGRLHIAISRHMASRGRGELRFRMDPKDLS